MIPCPPVSSLLASALVLAREGQRREIPRVLSSKAVGQGNWQGAGVASWKTLP